MKTISPRRTAKEQGAIGIEGVSLILSKRGMTTIL